MWKRDKEFTNLNNVSPQIGANERQQTDEHLLELSKLRSIGIIAGGIAHDLNNMLTIILGYISMVKFDVKGNINIFDKLTMAEKASLRAKGLAQQLLIFSKGESLIKKAAPILDIIKDSANFALSGSNVGYELSISDDLWSVEIDEDQMNQVFNNLIINARQAIPEGGTIKITAENIIIEREIREYGMQLQSGNHLKISIEDNGVGIPEKHLQKIFDPYFTSKQAGNGLGLATTYSIIKKHGGLITVDSRPGVGTIFYIYLPASRKDTRKKEDAKERIIPGRGKILVMDDEEDIRYVTKQMLVSIGYQVDLAKNGVEAINAYLNAIEDGKPFSAVIIDLTIQGGKGGKETIKELLEIDPNIKAIVSSGYPDNPVMTNYKKYGFKDVMAKPYKIEKLSKILNDVIMNYRDENIMFGNNQTNPVACSQAMIEQ